MPRGVSRKIPTLGGPSDGDVAVADDLRTALLNLSARSAVRARLVGRGLPVITFVVAYFVLVGFGIGAVLAAGGALVAAVATYGVVALALRAKYHATVYESPDWTPMSLAIVGYVLTTADDETLFVGRVNTTWYAHPDCDVVVDDLLDAATALANAEDAPATVPNQHAEDAFRFGIVDVDETKDRIEQRIREETKGRLRNQNGMMDAETLEEKLAEHPDHAVQRVLRTLRVRGELRRQGGYHYLG